VLSSILSQGILNGSIYALVGIGLGLTYGKQNVIDVANPAFVIVGSYLVLALSQYFGLDPFIVTPLALVALFLAGVAVQFLLVNPLLKRPDFEMHVQSDSPRPLVEVRLTDAWVWDMYRKSRFVPSVRVLTFKDVNIEELPPQEL